MGVGFAGVAVEGVVGHQAVLKIHRLGVDTHQPEAEQGSRNKQRSRQGSHRG